MYCLIFVVSWTLFFKLFLYVVSLQLLLSCPSFLLSTSVVFYHCHCCVNSMASISKCLGIHFALRSFAALEIHLVCKLKEVISSLSFRYPYPYLPIIWAMPLLSGQTLLFQFHYDLCHLVLVWLTESLLPRSLCFVPLADLLTLNRSGVHFFNWWVGWDDFLWGRYLHLPLNPCFEMTCIDGSHYQTSSSLSARCLYILMSTWLPTTLGFWQ